ncbi:MAG TPA: heavy metal sensor histidine kinase [Urbifossiella sp.]|jgi:two-component system heavy metal sensor histidine kinase CusS|nr:heavy metal sensor histidine kinase [Urbifossiella sp.]
MSSKTAADPRPWSLATRLTLWYAGSAFALVALVTAYLHAVVVRDLEREDDEWLAARAGAVLRRAEARPADLAALRAEVEEGAERAAEPMLLRVRTPAGVVETPGLAELVPGEAFPPPGGVRDYRAAGGRLLRLRTEAGPGGAVTVSAALDRSEDEELVDEYRWHIAAVLGVALVVCAAGSHRLARRGLRPLVAVTATARRIGPGRLGERIAAAGLPAEIGALAGTFNGMLARLEDAFGRLSRFSADIAHELRTPVNAMRGEVEVALGRPRTGDEYRDVLGSCLEECGRLARLIDSLLFLARAEDPKTVLVTEPVDLGRELTAAREFFEPAAAEAGIALAAEAGPGLIVPADRGLVQRAVGNLVANALAHTPAGGTVTLRAVAAGGAVRVEVADTGEGIAPEHLPYLFDRFYRADPARAGGGRVGLGLAIVKGVADLHGAAAAVASTPGRGTTVTLTFPAAKMTES